LRTALAATAAAVVALGVCGYAGWRTLGPFLPHLRLPDGPSCVAQAGGEVDLDPEQMANAATISAVGIRRKLPVRAVVVALAAALQESKLRNLPGGDRDSLGLFQQRPSKDWGTREQIADPRYAANAFYSELVAVRGWQTMRVTDAAQAVQRSAHPEAYERWADNAAVLARALSGDATGAVSCRVSSEPERRGTGAITGLVAGLRDDWGKIQAHTTDAPPGMTLAATTSRTGWQYANWLVAHAEERGVQRVGFGTQEWTARSSRWSATGSAPPAPANQVVAEVYP
jgi:hypothetical protein